MCVESSRSSGELITPTSLSQQKSRKDDVEWAYIGQEPDKPFGGPFWGPDAPASSEQHSPVVFGNNEAPCAHVICCQHNFLNSFYY